MSQTFGFNLSDIMDVSQLMDMLNRLKQFGLVALSQCVFQTLGAVKVIFDHTFAAIGNDQNIRDACGYRFFNDILDRGFVYDRKHFFGHCFCCGKNSGSQSRGGNNCFCDFHFNTSEKYIDNRR